MNLQTLTPFLLAVTGCLENGCLPKRCIQNMNIIDINNKVFGKVCRHIFVGISFTSLLIYQSKHPNRLLSAVDC